MKRVFLLLLCASLLLCACAENNVDTSSVQSASQSENSVVESVADTTPPVIKISSAYAVSTVKKGEEIDLMQGVTGKDDVDGNITDKIIVDKSGFDINTAGEYTITYSLCDSAGNESQLATKTIIVRETSVLTAFEIWNEDINGEIKNPENPKLFGGAWYHKIVSSRDKWEGIEGTVTLPEVKIRRYAGDADLTLDCDANFKNLDNPSVYLGGNALNESDVGLSFSKCLIDVDNKKISTGCIAFRPFWRYITADNQDVGDYAAHNGEYAVSANGNNCIANYHWKYTEYYYLPGDTLRIIIYIPAPNKMQLQIEVIEKSTLPSSVETRKKYGWNDPEDFLSPVFTSPGHGSGRDTEYKRVNAIDQVANEGGNAIVSDTEVTNAVWHSTYLYRNIAGTVYRVPMDETRRGFIDAPESGKFTVTYDGVDKASGGETVSIHPGKAG